MTIDLRTQAVEYAARQVVAGELHSIIKANLLTLPEFAPLLIDQTKIEACAYVEDIIDDGEDAADIAFREDQERDIRRYEGYLAEYPELDRHREW
jgi:hypothetical protein